MDVMQMLPVFLGFLLTLLHVDVSMVVGSQDDQCRFVFKENVVLDVEASQDNGAEVVEDIHTKNKIQCAEKCCSAEGSWCSLAMFHTQAGEDEINCFLIRCLPVGSTKDACVKQHMPHSGFISANVTHHINHPTPTRKPTTQPRVPSTTSKPTPQPQVPSTSKPTTQPKVPSTTSKPTTQTTTTQVPATTTTTEPEKIETTPSPEWTSPAEQAANETSVFNKSQPMGTTESQNTSSEDHNETRNHVEKQIVTQTGILIVMLCFGIIFMLVMLVVTGKRWCEGYRHRKYSKVDYLVNGMYS